MSNPHFNDTLPIPSDESQTVRALWLDSWAPLRVSGADAESFLQGQLSADLRALRPDRAQWASYNSPKGRMLAVVLMVRDGEVIELWLPRGLIEPVARRLRMFVMRSKAVIEMPTDAVSSVAVLGSGTEQWLAAHGFPVPTEPTDVVHTEALRVLRAAGETPRFLLSGAPNSLASMISNEASADEDWRAADIAAGIPVVYPETQDRWVAQMTNLDLLGGISFEKGCYTGQEVVARLHYLGNLKKRMFLVLGQGEAPAAGSAIRNGEGDGQAVGDVVDACASDNGFIATAVLQLAVSGSDSLRLDRAADAALSRPRTFVYPGAPNGGS